MDQHNSVLRALKHRNYRLFFSGQSISLIGTWLTRVAMSWLVFRLSHSAFILGLVGFASQIPTFLFAPVAGVLVDRWDRHRVLVVTQVLAMIQSAILALLTLTNLITIPELLALGAFQGFINAFDMPARQSFVVEMIEDRKDLPNAIALNSSMVNMARLVGPSVAGVLIAAVGEGACFTIDAISYIAVVVSLVMMRIPVRPPVQRAQKRIVADLREGLQYSISFFPIRSVLALLALVSVMGVPYMTLLPVIVTGQLNGGPHTLGYLSAFSGLGALLGVFYLASRKSVIGLGRIIMISSALFGLALMAFSHSKNQYLSMALIFLVGMGMMVQMAASNTIIQTIVDEDKRSRVMSLYTVAVAGMVPFGSLLSGMLGSRIGAPNTILVGGAICFLGALVFLKALPEIRRHIRPIYVKMGIISETAAEIAQAAGIQSATSLMSPPAE